MSLVFRKAIFPKNAALLKYFKGRPLASVAKRNNGVLSTAVLRHRTLMDRARLLLMGACRMTEKPKPLPSASTGLGRSQNAALRFCVSCPDVVHLSTKRACGSPISGATYSLQHRTGSLPSLVSSNKFHSSSRVDKCAPPCKCGCPCGPCGCPSCYSCLPPPCNTPPRCIQYMTGYYYYPYGFWFCGPYHVSGTCVPSGPCCPGSACGPCCGPPCGPCGPPCRPSCPCPKCCACLSPITTAMVGGDPNFNVSGMPSPQAMFTPCPVQQKVCTSYPPRPLPVLQPQALARMQAQAQLREEPAKPNQPFLTKGGISKFFPFNTIPSLSKRGMPPPLVHVCPYSTRTSPQLSVDYANPFPEQIPVYCTPCVKSASSRPRQYFITNSYERRLDSMSRPIYHKRSKRVNCELCPGLESPRRLLTKEERDRPNPTGVFQYTNIPCFKKPFPPLIHHFYSERDHKEDLT